MRQIFSMFICLALLMTAQAQDKEDLIHTVGPGDTLISIANRYGVTLEQLLSLNSLDPDAYLQIGQRLVVLPDAVDVEDEAEPEARAEPVSVGGSAEGYAAAPVIDASAPMTDPSDISPLLCFSLFEDANQNGMREPGESWLVNGEIVLYDSEGAEQLHYTTDGESEPYCLRDLGQRLYRLDAVAPAGYGLTSAASLHLDLRSGGKLSLEFGAKQGVKTLTAPPPALLIEEAPEAAVAASGLLRELSGLVVLALAAAVFASGMVLAVFLRGR